MNFEELFYDFLIEAETRDELNRLINELNDAFIAAEYQVLEANNLWEDYEKEEAK